MDGFKITPEQIARIIGGSVADELSRRFDRHTDFVTVATWGGHTELGVEGIDLEKDQIDACAIRIERTFDLADGVLSRKARSQIADWADVIASRLRAHMHEFTFFSAAPGQSRAAHRHGADDLYQDAAAAANVLFGRRRLHSFVAPHNLVGFVLTILAANLQGIESVDIRRRTPDDLKSFLAYGDVLVATPTLWRYLMREGLVAPDNTMAASFGEALRPELAAAMRKAGFSVVREFFGATECGLLAWRDGPDEPFQLFDHWRRAGSGVARSVDPKAAALINDELDWRGETAFQVAGRRDGAVQIGAVTVFPDYVESRLREHALIRTCAIRADLSEDGVARLAAHIVLSEGAAPTADVTREIDAFCRVALRHHERPRIFHFYAAKAAPGP